MDNHRIVSIVVGEVTTNVITTVKVNPVLVDHVDDIWMDSNLRIRIEGIKDPSNVIDIANFIKEVFRTIEDGNDLVLIRGTVKIDDRDVVERIDDNVIGKVNLKVYNKVSKVERKDNLVLITVVAKVQINQIWIEEDHLQEEVVETNRTGMETGQKANNRMGTRNDIVTNVSDDRMEQDVNSDDPT